MPQKTLDPIELHLAILAVREACASEESDEKEARALDHLESIIPQPTVQEWRDRLAKVTKEHASATKESEIAQRKLRAANQEIAELRKANGEAHMQIGFEQSRAGDAEREADEIRRRLLAEPTSAQQREEVAQEIKNWPGTVD